MLPRRYRLTREEFDLVRQNGQLVPGRLFGLLLYRLPTPPSSPISPVFPKAGLASPKPLAKAGLIVSTKLSKKAVVRNQLKRRLRAAIQTILPLIKIPVHFVVLPNHRALLASVEELKIELKSALSNVAM